MQEQRDVIRGLEALRNAHLNGPNPENSEQFHQALNQELNDELRALWSRTSEWQAQKISALSQALGAQLQEENSAKQWRKLETQFYHMGEVFLAILKGSNNAALQAQIQTVIEQNRRICREKQRPFKVQEKEKQLNIKKYKRIDYGSRLFFLILLVIVVFVPMPVLAKVLSSIFVVLPWLIYTIWNCSVHGRLEKIVNNYKHFDIDQLPWPIYSEAFRSSLSDELGSDHLLLEAAEKEEAWTLLLESTLFEEVLGMGGRQVIDPREVKQAAPIPLHNDPSVGDAKQDYSTSINSDTPPRIELGVGALASSVGFYRGRSLHVGEGGLGIEIEEPLNPLWLDYEPASLER